MGLKDSNGFRQDRQKCVARQSVGPNALSRTVVALTADQRERLRPHVGKPVCGLAEAFGLTSVDAGGYRPSIPIVSLQAARLAVARLVAHHMGFAVTSNLVQYDGLFGPQAATVERMEAPSWMLLPGSWPMSSNRCGPGKPRAELGLGGEERSERDLHDFSPPRSPSRPREAACPQTHCQATRPHSLALTHTP